jgi:hypothetical protein
MRVFALLLAVALLQSCGPADDPAPVETGVAPPVPAPPAPSPDALAEHLPASLDGHDRVVLDQSSDSALGAEVVRASATYGGGTTLSIADFQTAEMTEKMGYDWGLAPGAETLDGLPVHRGTDGDDATVLVLVDGRLLVEATAPTQEAAQAALRSVDLAGLR